MELLAAYGALLLVPIVITLAFWVFVAWAIIAAVRALRAIAAETTELRRIVDARLPRGEGHNRFAP